MLGICTQMGPLFYIFCTGYIIYSMLCLEEELRNIIDKLANFVARNGPKFEELTKSKQRDNPKFSFLFGGDYHEYYKWKVSIEGM